MNLEFKPTGITEVLDQQGKTPFYQSHGVDELLRMFPEEVTQKMAYYLFTLGYMEGKQATN